MPILGLEKYLYSYHDFILITHYLSCLLTQSADNFIQYITHTKAYNELPVDIKCSSNVRALKSTISNA